MYNPEWERGQKYEGGVAVLDQVVFDSDEVLATWDKTIIATLVEVTGQINDIRIDWGAERYYVRRNGVDNPPASFVADGRGFEIHVFCSYQYATTHRCGVRCEVWNPNGVLVYDQESWDDWPYWAPGGPYEYFSRNIGALDIAGNWRARITFMAY